MASLGTHASGAHLPYTFEIFGSASHGVEFFGIFDFHRFVSQKFFCSVRIEFGDLSAESDLVSSLLDALSHFEHDQFGELVGSFA